MHTLASNFPEEFHIHAVTHILGQKNTKAHQSTTIHIVAELLLYGSAVYILFFQCKGQRISCVLLKCNMRFRECTLLISVFKEWQLKKIWLNLWSSAGIVMMNLINIQYLKYTAESMKKSSARTLILTVLNPKSNMPKIKFCLNLIIQIYQSKIPSVIQNNPYYLACSSVWNNFGSNFYSIVYLFGLKYCLRRETWVKEPELLASI